MPPQERSILWTRAIPAGQEVSPGTVLETVRVLDVFETRVL